MRADYNNCDANKFLEKLEFRLFESWY